MLPINLVRQLKWLDQNPSKLDAKMADKLLSEIEKLAPAELPRLQQYAHATRALDKYKTAMNNDSQEDFDSASEDSTMGLPTPRSHEESLIEHYYEHLKALSLAEVEVINRSLENQDNSDAMLFKKFLTTWDVTQETRQVLNKLGMDFFLVQGATEKAVDNLKYRMAFSDENVSLLETKVKLMDHISQGNHPNDANVLKLKAEISYARAPSDLVEAIEKYKSNSSILRQPKKLLNAASQSKNHKALAKGLQHIVQEQHPEQQMNFKQ